MTSSLTEFDLLAIVALLPIAALMTLLQKNPYHALIVRGMLGAIAALVYALLGAADVALTEAMVGTMLAITLYVVAVRSSLVLQLGVLVEPAECSDTLCADALTLRSNDEQLATEFEPLLEDVRSLCRQHFLRLELLLYVDQAALQGAIDAKEVHATAVLTPPAHTDTVESVEPIDELKDELNGEINGEINGDSSPETAPPYTLRVRVPRLYELMQTELKPEQTALLPTFSIESTATAAPTPQTSHS